MNPRIRGHGRCLTCTLLVGICVLALGWGPDVSRAQTSSTPPPPPPNTNLVCLSKGIQSYCVPGTNKYQVCVPTRRLVECPIGSTCKEMLNSRSERVAYCKFVG